MQTQDPDPAASPRRSPPRSPSASVAAFALAFAAALTFLGCQPPPAPLHPVALTPLEGPAQPFSPNPTNKAVVYVFVGVDCPISNRFLPELASLERRYSPQGVPFVTLYPNPDETAEVIRKHRAEYGLDGAAYRDPGFTVARQLQTHRTPEVVVVSTHGRRLYQGRVNDQYSALGVGKPAPTRHDLAEVLEHLVTGRELAPRIEPAIGCSFRPYP